LDYYAPRENGFQFLAAKRIPSINKPLLKIALFLRNDFSRDRFGGIPKIIRDYPIYSLSPYNPNFLSWTAMYIDAFSSLVIVLF